jgi:dynein heavy chain
MYGDVNNKIANLMSILLEITRNKEIMGGARTNAETLITIHVHQKDVFEDLTRNSVPEKNVKSIGDFDWLK